MSCHRQKTVYGNSTVVPTPNILGHPLEAIMRIFIMTIGEFMVFYRQMVTLCDRTMMAHIGKVCSIFIFKKFFIHIKTKKRKIFEKN